MNLTTTEMKRCTYFDELWAKNVKTRVALGKTYEQFVEENGLANNAKTRELFERNLEEELAWEAINNNTK